MTFKYARARAPSLAWQTKGGADFLKASSTEDLEELGLATGAFFLKKNCERVFEHGFRGFWPCHRCGVCVCVCVCVFVYVVVCVYVCVSVCVWVFARGLYVARS